jgi:hypothetical protein
LIRDKYMVEKINESVLGEATQRVASDIALSLLDRTLSAGGTITIPSLGISISQGGNNSVASEMANGGLAADSPIDAPEKS